MWLDSGPNCAASVTDADGSADTHRNADRDTDPHTLTFGKPVAERERLTKPDRGSLRLRAVRNRMGLCHHVRGPWYRAGWEPDRYVHRRGRADGSGFARHHCG
jgi:hypothetical protein